MLTLLVATSLLVVGLNSHHDALAFVVQRAPVSLPTFGVQSPSTSSALNAVTVKKKYVPKWKKKQTLADEAGNLDAKDVGLIGTIPVVFKQGNDTRTTMAIVGQPVSDVAAQAGQFIKYGCKKGECGTCEAMCNGKWIRPCVSAVPALPEGEQYVVQVKAIKSATTSSGTFFSVKSFFMGFYNNLLGMAGFVKRRRAARQNYLERLEYEEMIKKLTEDKKKQKMASESSAAENLRP